MATAAFGPVLETALKQDIQGGTLTLQSGRTVYPRFYCCVSGTTVGVAKDPVARKISSVIRACAGSPVCIDYSRSWSPSSTILTWSIDWGDGQVSGGGWPGPGNVCHPLGGYLLPGTYKVVLTVVDMLGARGTDTQEIEVIDCDTGPDLELYGSCGASGVWHSLNAGVDWENVSTETLLDTEVYDLKVHPFTIGTDYLELWAATEKGLYKTTDAAGCWARVMLPEPELGLGEPEVASIVCSTVDPAEVYVLAYQTVPSNQTWLYRTIDGGLTWTHTLVGDIQCTDEIVPSMGCFAFWYRARGYYPVTGRFYTLYQCGAGAASMMERNPDTQTWINKGRPPGASYMMSFVIDDDYIWVCGQNNAGNRALWRYNGTSWWEIDSGDAGCYNMMVEREDGYLYCMAGVAPNYSQGSHVDTWAKPGWRVGQTTVPYNNINCIGKSGNTLLAIANDAGADYVIIRWTGMSWIDEYRWGFTAGIVRLGFCEFDGSVYALKHNPADVLKRSGSTWYVLADQPGSTPREIKVPALAPGEMWCDQYMMYAGTDVWSKGVTCTGFAGMGGAREYDANGDILSGDWPASNAEIIRTDYISGKVADVGRTHLLDMSPDGWFVYVGLLDGSNNPIIMRVVYDFSTAPVIIRHTGAGTWGGVRCDYNHPERVWTFGDFGAASKALLSDDWGDTFTDITEGTWAANEVVRCVLPSIYDPNDIIAILSTDQESWHSGDAGTTWVKTGDIPYGVHCGERDWIEEFNVFVGRVNAGAEHIRYSPNNGVHWYEHSGGFEPNAPVTALQIVA